MIRGQIQHEDKIIIKKYAPNIETAKYIKQIVTDPKGEIDNNPRSYRQ